MIMSQKYAEIESVDIILEIYSIGYWLGAYIDIGSLRDVIENGHQMLLNWRYDELGTILRNPIST